MIRSYRLQPHQALPQIPKANRRHPLFLNLALLLPNKCRTRTTRPRTIYGPINTDPLPEYALHPPTLRVIADGVRRQEELAVHKQKVEEVAHWLEEAFGDTADGRLSKYRVSSRSLSIVRSS